MLVVRAPFAWEGQWRGGMMMVRRIEMGGASFVLAKGAVGPRRFGTVRAPVKCACIGGECVSVVGRGCVRRACVFGVVVGSGSSLKAAAG